MATKPTPKSPLAFNDESFVSPEVVQKFKEKFWAVHPRDTDRLTKDSMDWFRATVIKNIGVRADKLIASHEYRKKMGTENRQLIGKMYLYQYKAENAGDAEAGVYDKFPLVFFFNAQKNKQGKMVLYGLNLHYAPPRIRMALLLKLLTLRSSKETRPGMRLKMTWSILKAIANNAVLGHLVHAYRVDRVQSRLVEIPAQDWSVVVFMQLAKWTNVAHNTVHQTNHRSKVIKRFKKLQP